MDNNIQQSSSDTFQFVARAVVVDVIRRFIHGCDIATSIISGISLPMLIPETKGCGLEGIEPLLESDAKKGSLKI
jgi:hypothetical protein